MVDPPAGIQVTDQSADHLHRILTPDALTFLARLHRTFDGRRRELLAAGVELAGHRTDNFS